MGVIRWKQITIGASGELGEFSLRRRGSRPAIGLVKKRAYLEREMDVTTRKELMMTGYCLKCRDHREMRDTEKVTLKNGRPATRGKCVECDTNMFRIGGTTARG